MRKFTLTRWAGKPGDYPLLPPSSPARGTPRFLPTIRECIGGFAVLFICYATQAAAYVLAPPVCPYDCIAPSEFSRTAG